MVTIDRTPTPQEVREGYACWHEYQEDGAAGIPIPESEAAFNRMLESVRAEERERIAQAIERSLPGRDDVIGGFKAGARHAARIAREGA